MSTWNRAAQFQYDSADLPFQPQDNDLAGSLESSTPFWRVNSFSDMEKSFASSDEASSSKEIFRPFIRLLSTSSHSSDNMSDIFDDDGVSPLVPKVGSVDSCRFVTHSLPATPFSTPSQTPYATPLSTPNPTPQNSPMLQRKTEMDAVRKAATRCGSYHLSQEPTSQNISKWFYVGFLAHSNNGSSEACVPTDALAPSSQMQQLAKRRLQQPAAAEKVDLAADGSDMRPISSGAACRSNNSRRNYRFAMSNRDMNFLAPTSM